MRLDETEVLRRRLGVAAVFTFVAAVLLALPAREASAQFGGLVSPGVLSKPHAKLEGIANCEKCHEKGKQVSAPRCLECHKPIAERIAAKKGVHRAAGSDCVKCHIEHGGLDTDLRHFIEKGFDHAKETGFALDGKHAPLADQCAKCHKGRSFLTARPECASCHQDPHKGKLGASCAACHAVTVAFKDTLKAFDHSKAAFQLEGGHRTVLCEKCHVGKVWKGLKFQLCTDCHRNPHKESMGTDCKACHVAIVPGWKVEKFDHAKAGTPLLGKHLAVPCARCHVKAATQVRLRPAPCAACHQDPHRGEFKQDCASCHKEIGWKGAPFDHAARTRFPLLGKHAPLACTACHKPTGAVPAASRANGLVTVRAAGGGPPPGVDFRGLKTECAACHADPHKGQLGSACEKCHSAAFFKVQTFEHPRFPEFFAGQHATLACEKCHRNGANGHDSPPGARLPAAATRIYRNLPTDCATCHRDVHLGQVGAKCETCHTVAAAKFAAPAFRHDETAFRLTGKHSTTECQKCHRKESAAFPAGQGTAVRYRGVQTACVACHKDVHLGQVGQKCETCHGTADFRVPTYLHKKPVGFFRGKHATVPCQDCHKKVEADFPSGHGTAVKLTGFAGSCTTCHKDPHAGQLGPNCEGCHAVDTAWMTASRAFHKAGGFPLEGRHLSVACERCHVAGVIKGTPTTCYDCHWIRRQDDKYRTRLGNQCETCHRPTSWSQVQWDHASRTGFALNSAHRSLACDQCHKNQVFQGTSPDCVSCHMKDYNATRNPNHAAAGFPTTCLSCHSASDATWNQAHFAHTSFPLAGVHATRACADCHVGGVWKGTPTLCSGCHLALYNATRTPPHAANGFATTCNTCHKYTDPDWLQARYTHQSFQLVGVHATRACADCHGNGVWKGTATTCAGCHLPLYNATRTPPHAPNGIGTACDSCHKNSDPDWLQARYTHQSFQLVGVHATRACTDCHVGGVWKGTATTCVGCHLPLYNATSKPNHAASNFPTACESCHKATDPNWTLGTFAHSSFPLAGVHLTRNCTDCHTNNNYTTIPTTCVGCHLPLYNATKTPPHAANGIATTCDSCHKYTDPDWLQAKYTHKSFQLVGVHAARTCTDCHVGGVWAGTSTLCSSCHIALYNATKTPPHAASNFPTTCDTCHKATDPNWLVATFTHSTFPLVGVHATRACTDCHTNGNYTTVPMTCSGCHLPLYNATKIPPHGPNGFATTCDSCHKATDPDWLQAKYTHKSFQLVGVHATRTCTDCHVGGVWAGTSTLCSSCHLPLYNATKTPPHAASNFPTTCDTCHKATDPNWLVATFTHSTFPLVGVHATRACTDCHTNGNYTTVPMTCSGCHLPLYNATKIPPHGPNGFATTCDSCHKATDPDWLQAKYTHKSFQLVGVHATRTCTDCHVGGVWAGTSTLCSSCHIALYNATKTPPHAASNFPTTCDTCHKATDPNWLVATFTHSTFPLVGVHATRACTDCHTNGNYTTVPMTCSGCHLPLYNATKIPPHGPNGFATTCDSCHKATDPDWLQAKYTHKSFQLVGVHATRTCTDCHVGGVWAGTSTLCSSCHIALYNATKTPPHAASNFPTTCNTCHKATDPNWLVATFTHSTFPLVGVHATRACTDCHTNGNYTTVPMTCSGCHLPLYNATKIPPHGPNGFATTCDSCHKATDPDWLQAKYTHKSFQLVGVHATRTCTDCHVGGVWAGTSTLCSSCHIALYNATTNPNHKGAGFPTTCDTCHKATDPNWLVAVFNHTWFPITSGRHSGIPCATCHTSATNYAIFSCTTGCHPASSVTPHHTQVSGYTYTSTACYSCHPRGSAG